MTLTINTAAAGAMPADGDGGLKWVNQRSPLKLTVEFHEHRLISLAATPLIDAFEFRRSMSKMRRSQKTSKPESVTIMSRSAESRHSVIAAGLSCQLPSRPDAPQAATRQRREGSIRASTVQPGEP